MSKLKCGKPGTEMYRKYMREYMKKRYAEDPEFKRKHNEYAKNWRNNNIERVKEKYDEWKEKNREHVNAYAREYHRKRRKNEKNPEDL